MLAKEKIRLYRKNAGLDTTELADRVGVTQAAISRYENGYVKRIPDYVLEKLAKVFHCNINDLIGEDPAYGHLQDPDTRSAIQDAKAAEDDRLILSWFHSLSPAVKDYFIEIARQSSENTAA